MQIISSFATTFHDSHNIISRFCSKNLLHSILLYWDTLDGVIMSQLNDYLNKPKSSKISKFPSFIFHQRDAWIRWSDNKICPVVSKLEPSRCACMYIHGFATSIFQTTNSFTNGGNHILKYTQPLQGVSGDDLMPQTSFYEWYKALKEGREECSDFGGKWDMQHHLCEVGRTSGECWLLTFSSRYRRPPKNQSWDCLAEFERGFTHFNSGLIQDNFCRKKFSYNKHWKWFYIWHHSVFWGKSFKVFLLLVLKKTWRWEIQTSNLKTLQYHTIYQH